MQGPKNAPPWDPEASPAYWLNNASRLLLRRHDARLRELGFSMGHLPVLVALEEGDQLSQKELARRARVEQPTMAEVLARMERDGLVRREPNPADRRGSLVSLTPTARARVPKAKAALARGQQEALAGLDEREQATLLALLRRVAENLGAAPPGEQPR